MKLTTHLHIEPRLKVGEASAAPPNMPSWHAERHLCFQILQTEIQQVWHTRCLSVSMLASEY